MKQLFQPKFKLKVMGVLLLVFINTGSLFSQTMTFDIRTNQPPVATTANIDTLFTFSQSIGSAYTGVWTTPAILTITIVTPAGASPVVNVMTVTVKAGGNLKDHLLTSNPSQHTSNPITGVSSSSS